MVYSPTNELPSNPTSLRETEAIDALELGARRMDFIGMKFQMADELRAIYARAEAASLQKEPMEGDVRVTKGKMRAQIGGDLYTLAGPNGRIQDIKDGYSLLRDLYAQTWLRTTRPYALRQVLEHFDSAILLWQSRADQVRVAQRQWANERTLPPAQAIGMPAPVTK